MKLRIYRRTKRWCGLFSAPGTATRAVYTSAHDPVQAPVEARMGPTRKDVTARPKLIGTVGFTGHAPSTFRAVSDDIAYEKLILTNNELNEIKD